MEDFLWWRSRNRWHQVGNRLELEPWGEGERYAPMSEGIDDIFDFRRLAYISNSVQLYDAVRNFADKYGMFNNDEGMYVDEWYSRAVMMDEVLTTCSAAKERDTKVLRERIHWRQGQGQYCDYAHGSFEDFIIADKLTPDRTHRVHWNDLVGPAEIWVAAQINQNLWERSRAILVFANETSTDQKLSYVPTDLLGAMWLKFSQIVADGRFPTPCENCGELIDNLRSTRRYCSNRCRTAAFRKRNKATVE